ncbi:MAG TPA: hypothetical protein VFD92_16295 [Candidatus Binatia bacterium]|nr:hypothetical protein [Candidatus Binatia bacterium]
MRRGTIGFVVAATWFALCGSALAAGPAGATGALAGSLARPVGIRAADSDGPTTRSGTTPRIGGAGAGSGLNGAVASPLGSRMNRAVPQMRSTLTPLPR